MNWSEVTGGGLPKRARKSAATKGCPVAEFSIVKLGKPVETKQGTVPAGSSGTLVHAYSDGQAYVIEFYEPFHALATVEADAIAA